MASQSESFEEFLSRVGRRPPPTAPRGWDEAKLIVAAELELFCKQLGSAGIVGQVESKTEGAVELHVEVPSGPNEGAERVLSFGPNRVGELSGPGHIAGSTVKPVHDWSPDAVTAAKVKELAEEFCRRVFQ